MQLDNVAEMVDEPVPLPVAVSAGANVTVPVNEQLAAPGEVWNASGAGGGGGSVMESVPDTLAELRPRFLAQPVLRADGSSRLNAAGPGNDPVAVPVVTCVAAIPPLPRQLITVERAAPVCDEEEQLKGLELNSPRSGVRDDGEKPVDVFVQPDSFPETLDGPLPPPESFSGGEKRTIPKKVQLTDPVAIRVVCARVAAEPACDVRLSIPTTTIGASSRRG